ncbi:MAG: hypothetical protein ACOC84_11685, partial [Actinomycetota bacterium]
MVAPAAALRTDLPDSDVVEAGGFRATSPSRTAVDCARHLPPAGALTVVDHVLRLGVLLRAGLPLPELQVEIATRRGRFRPDFVWPELRLILEFDGMTRYSGEHGPAPAVLVAERQREKELTNAGWHVLRSADRGCHHQRSPP